MSRILAVFVFFGIFFIYVKIWETGWWVFSTTNALWQLLLFAAGLIVSTFIACTIARLRLL